MAVAAISVQQLGVVATGTITQYAAITGAGVIATAAGNALGFAQTGGASGARIPTAVLGTSIAIAGAAIAVGAAVEVGSAGKVVTKSAGVAIGRAMTASAADGDQIEIFLIPN